MSLIRAYFPIFQELISQYFFGTYDNLTSEHVPGQLKYDVCMTEQVSGPQGTKRAGRHMVMAPNKSKYQFLTFQKVFYRFLSL